ncbi:putative glycerophosphodiester phosphodiesterase, protein kinase RLK-Pelle-LRK10L-2 family [Medicago truncatula]|nr:receptor-like kinase [Medicago truncatula]RHN47262.1 putative glycerophosphodiester phosphodiesterase, protein kinase RLK-Pelle-LRK10L-2 family [Medicago truncatula]
MKPLIHHSSSIVIFFYSIILMISIINIPKCLCVDNNQYTNCSKTFNCESNITNLEYPFWGENRGNYCGVSDPNMKLTCEGKVPKITINFVKYRILEWNNATLRLRVARDDYWSNICALSDNHKNSTFNNTFFQRYGNTSSKVTLLYNYNTSLPRSVVEIPILDTQAAKIATVNDVNQALEKGFELKWTGNYSECQKCVDSGGVCGNDGGIGFKCFCKNGTSTTTCSSPLPLSSRSKRDRRLIVIGASVAGFGVTMFFIIFISCYFKKGIRRPQMTIFRKRRKHVDNNVEVFMQSYNLSIARRYSYAEVKRITNSFRDKLGHGGYGVVYKASLTDGRQVAVKVINESKGNGEEFINEVASISRTSHMNIVSLLGYCYEANKRALIYEFMPKGSLDKFIYKSGFPDAVCDFDSNTLFQIAIGIARGLEYLHQGCSSRILHLDIKPQNILLDENFCPKISDFGLAKICQMNDSIVSIPGTRGTIGYMAPEVFSRAFGGVSYKSDVYSYGMLILEMIGGRKNYQTGGSCTSEMYFPDWIYKDLEQGNDLLNSLTISEEENDMVKKITMVSLWCIQTNPLDRPPMNKVIEMLQGPLSSVTFPPKPVLFSPKRPPLQLSNMSSSDWQETNSITTETELEEEPIETTVLPNS